MVTELATQELARETAAGIRAGLAAAPDISRDLREAYRNRDWETLGYASWEQYLTGEFGEDGLTYGAHLGGGAPDRRAVYFIQPTAGGLIKIGVAGDPRRRLASVGLMSPVPLRLLAVIPEAGEDGERKLHARFASQRVRGEWFEPTPDLLAYIAENGVRP